MIEDEIKVKGEEYALRTSQLRNFRKVVASSMPTKRYNYLSEKVLPGYIRRNFNAQSELSAALDKKYNVKRAVSKKTSKAKSNK